MEAVPRYKLQNVEVYGWTGLDTPVYCYDDQSTCDAKNTLINI